MRKLPRGLRAGTRYTVSAVCAILGALVCVVFVRAAPVDASSVPTAPLGVDVATGLYDTGPVDTFQSLVGVPVGIVQNFVSWEYTDSSTFQDFPTSHVMAIIADGHTPEITWDPSIAGDSSVNQPSMSLASIIDGDHDSYIMAFAKAAAAVKAPIMLRFAHEMNLSSVSYAESNSGNQAGDFVKAWRHVWGIFQQEGATNVQWIWSPNIVNPGDDSLAELYPGDLYVNWVGVDGYSYPLEGCQTAQQEFTPALDEIARFSLRPVMLAETGIAAACVNKPALITSMFSWLETQPEIRSITWWERTESNANYLVESSAASEAAFKTGVASWDSWLSANPISTLLTTTLAATGLTTTGATSTTATSSSAAPTKTVSGAAIAAILKAWLKPLLSVSGKPGRLSAIKRAKAYRATFRAAIPGAVKVTWTVTEKIAHTKLTKTVTVASADTKTTGPSTVVKVKLTRSGVALLKKLKTERVRAAASFTFAFGKYTLTYPGSHILTLTG